MTLQAILDAFHKNWQHRVGAGVSSAVNAIMDEFCSAFSTASVAAPGDPFPLDCTLLDTHGARFDLRQHAPGRSLVVKIYRGGICPYCRLDLRAYQEALPLFAAKNTDIIAISPELPEFLAATAEDNDITFPLLSDPSGALTKKLGLHLPLSAEKISAFEKSGLDLRKHYGSQDWFMPAPSLFVLSPQRVIVEAFVFPAYNRRVEPDSVLQLL